MLLFYFMIELNVLIECYVRKLQFFAFKQLLFKLLETEVEDI